MTNLFALVLITNWITIGTFVPINNSKSFDIQEGQMMTNHIIKFDYQNSHYELLVKSDPGPKIGERKIETTITNNIYATNGFIIPTLVITNYINTQVTNEK
jgi:hypothetical protein